jgi:hypothetical protein
MTTEDIEQADDYPGGWFGESWGAPVCEEARRRETPIGEPCFDCGVPIIEDDQGMLIPHIFAEGQWRLTATHRTCFLRQIIGIGLDATESP